MYIFTFLLAVAVVQVFAAHVSQLVSGIMLLSLSRQSPTCSCCHPLTTLRCESDFEGVVSRLVKHQRANQQRAASCKNKLGRNAVADGEQNNAATTTRRCNGGGDKRSQNFIDEQINNRMQCAGTTALTRPPRPPPSFFTWLSVRAIPHETGSLAERSQPLSRRFRQDFPSANEGPRPSSPSASPSASGV